MQITPPSRQSLLRYLLHELDEAERETIDTLLITDPEYQARFQEVEYDLVDALAAGELSPGEAERARRALRGLNLPFFVAGRTMKAPSRISQRRTAKPVMWLAAAALILAAVALGVSRMRVSSLKNERANMAPARGIDEKGSVSTREQRPSASNEAKTEPTHEAPATHRRPIIAVLLPVATRSSNMLHLHIPHGAEVVRLDWPAPAVQEQSNGFQLQILDDTGKLFCRSRGRTTQGTGQTDGTLVHFVCPAQDVPAGVDFVRVAATPVDPEAPSLMEVTLAVEKDL